MPNPKSKIIMTDSPLVSILINNYNYGRFLGEAIDSALNQTYPNTEVVVVDDGSTDNSREIIASYQDRVIPVLKENGGQASAFNAGFEACKGDIICFLDSDDTFLPEKVTEVVELFRQHQDIGCCFHRLRLVDANTGALIRLSRESLSRKFDFRLQMRIMGRLPFCCPPTSGLSFTRSLLQQILPMPEASGVTISDMYLTRTATALSKGFFLDKQLVIQKIHGNNKYTQKNDEQLKSKISILTAYALRNNWPYLARFANSMFASGCVTYWKNKEVKTKHEIIRSYLSTVSPLEKLEINLKAFYYRLRIK